MRATRTSGGLEIAAAAAYVVLFAALSWPWLGVLDRAFPDGAALVDDRDERIIIWIVGWIAHALGHGPAHVFDAPINAPLAGQLTGSEHLLSSQLLASPVWWLTGNATLAANVVVLVSYPLAAWIMWRLLRSLGIAAAPAWVAGLGFALGPLAVPANLQTAQYLVVWLPATALGVRVLARSPDAAHAALYALVFTGALFSSYYMAVFASLVAAVWAGFEWLQAPPRRARFLGWLAAGTALPTALLALWSRPYFDNPGRLTAILSNPARAPIALGFGESIDALAIRQFGVVMPIVGAVGLGALASASLPRRRAAQAGLVLAVIGAGFFVGPRPFGLETWSPFWLIAQSPLAFVRAWWRFAVVVGFGMALLAAAALDLLGGRARVPWLSLAVAVALLAERGTRFLGDGLEPVPGQHLPIGAELAALHATEPMLVLPFTPDLEADAMVAQTHHWIPLVQARTGYRPPLRDLVDEMVRGLPEESAIDDLVVATGLKWILLAPEDVWIAKDVRTALLGVPEVATVAERDGWTLLRIDRTPLDDRWRRRLSTPWRPGYSVFGTPLGPLDSERAQGTARLVDPPRRVPQAWRIGVRVVLRNTGFVPWPAAPHQPYGLAIVLRWIPEEGDMPAPEPVVMPLRRDLGTGERMEQVIGIVTPERGGRWTLEASLRKEGAPPVRGLIRQTATVVIEPPPDA